MTTFTDLKENPINIDLSTMPSMDPTDPSCMSPLPESSLQLFGSKEKATQAHKTNDGGVLAPKAEKLRSKLDRVISNCILKLQGLQNQLMNSQNMNEVVYFSKVIRNIQLLVCNPKLATTDISSLRVPHFSAVKPAKSDVQKKKVEMLKTVAGPTFTVVIRDLNEHYRSLANKTSSIDTILGVARTLKSIKLILDDG
mmetsp:Transcript_17313/g.19294  ORF Transcript_17313/g.19294 Transcript_17313/m.19294 type:complete len:197 (+) Transcript_17313:1507-2097(+)